MALVVFLQEDEGVPSVYRNLKFFCETAPMILRNRGVLSSGTLEWLFSDPAVTLTIGRASLVFILRDVTRFALFTSDSVSTAIPRFRPYVK